MHNDIHSPLSQLILNDWCGLVGLSALHSSNDCQQDHSSLCTSTAGLSVGSVKALRTSPLLQVLVPGHGLS